ncbi:copper-containing nitrite reductase, partial [Mycolicibacterium sp.]|uniref:copper-containing nitrite reductase n=1 Tax=Mycolicibacterium sp. TaxID=2320850 RepID=UPI0037C8C2AA
MNNNDRKPGREPLAVAMVLAAIAGMGFWQLLPQNAAPAGNALISPVHASAPVPVGPAAKPGTLAHTITPLPVSGAGAASVVRDPTDLHKPLNNRAPSKVRVELETIELTGKLDDGSSYRFWTFNGRVPGPFVRVRVGDTVEVHLKNHEDSALMHNVDFHAVTGPGGGAMATDADPGEARSFEFKATNPGLYVYHCAVPMAAQHISNGMYGLILVEPEGGLPKVDHEFYVMQGELYTEQAFGTKGELTESHEKLMNERPEYFIFNGAVGALTTEKPLKAKVGETVRIYFGVGGPNYTSSFHVIGEIFDKLYNLGSLTATPLLDVQTATVPPGGAAVVEFKLEVPGNYILVDHALTRVARGLAGIIQVEGPDNPAIFKDHDPERSAQSMSH